MNNELIARTIVMLYSICEFVYLHNPHGNLRCDDYHSNLSQVARACYSILFKNVKNQHQL